jgi:DNA repair protein RadC
MEQILSAESISIIAEVELIYHPKTRPCERPKIKDSRSSYKILLDTWNKDRIDLQEEFKVMLLDRSGGVIGIKSLSTGGITATIADPKLIFVAALKGAACSIILAHNHPSGALRPSKADEELTRKVKGGGQLLDIKMLDHLIISPDCYFSFADEGLL